MTHPSHHQNYDPGAGATSVPTWIKVAAVAGPLLILISLAFLWLRPADQGSQPKSAPAAALPVGGVAQACLGGWQDVSQAVLTAHNEAPITEAGAAEFVATLTRWHWQTAGGEGVYMLAPVGAQLLAPSANEHARNTYNNPDGQEAPYPGWTIAANTDGMKYFVAVKSTQPLVAAVSLTEQITLSKPGMQPMFQTAAGTLEVTAINGKWYILNKYPSTGQGLHMSESELEAKGTTFAGRCA